MRGHREVTLQITHMADISYFPRRCGNELLMVVERGEKIVPSINEAFPKKEEPVENIDLKPKPYYQQVIWDYNYPCM